MDLHSDNFTAEMLLKLLALTSYDKGTTARGAKVVMHSMKVAGIPTAGVRIVDGSGLSSDDRLTVAALVSILQVFSTDPGLHAELLHALPVAGVSGTLRYRMRTRAAPRPRRRQDGHDEPGLVSLGLRERPHRLRGHPERASALVLVGP